MYEIVYLQTALDDMVDIARYITVELKNGNAAIKLTTKMVDMAESLKDMPYIYPAFIPLKPLKNEYRRILVDNYSMFYYIDEKNKTVTIARVIYSKRNLDNHL